MTLVTYTFSVAGMHCASCSILVDDTLEDLPGVKQSQTSLRDATSTVLVEPDQCAADDVVNAILALGYHAEHVP